jgi:lactoylglutathione lyase
MTTRPFKVLGIQQVAVGAPDKSALRRLWVDTLGLAPHGNFKSEKENVDEDIVTMGAGPFTVEVDLMQPIDPEKKPRVDTPPLNHIGRSGTVAGRSGRTVHPWRGPCGRRRPPRVLHPPQGQ